MLSIGALPLPVSPPRRTSAPLPTPMQVARSIPHSLPTPMGIARGLGATAGRAPVASRVGTFTVAQLKSAAAAATAPSSKVRNMFGGGGGGGGGESSAPAGGTDSGMPVEAPTGPAAVDSVAPPGGSSAGPMFVGGGGSFGGGGPSFSGGGSFDGGADWSSAAAGAGAAPAQLPSSDPSSVQSTGATAAVPQKALSGGVSGSISSGDWPWIVGIGAVAVGVVLFMRRSKGA